VRIRLCDLDRLQSNCPSRWLPSARNTIGRLGVDRRHKKNSRPHIAMSAYPMSLWRPYLGREFVSRDVMRILPSRETNAVVYGRGFEENAALPNVDRTQKFRLTACNLQVGLRGFEPPTSWSRTTQEATGKQALFCVSLGVYEDSTPSFVHCKPMHTIAESFGRDASRQFAKRNFPACSVQ
jgi:hypothetical protein